VPGKRRGNGAGSITYCKSRKRWCARLTLPLADGTKKRKAAYFQTSAEADAWLSRMKAKRDGGSPFSLDAETMTVGDWLTRWLEEVVKPSVAQSTYRHCETPVRIHLIPAIGDVLLTKFGVGHARMLSNGLQQKKTRSGATLHLGTVHEILSILSRAMNEAVRWELIEKNPFRLVRKPRVPKNTMPCLTEEQAAALVYRARGTDREALYLLALKTGMREGELLALRWQDLRFGERAIDVRRSVDTRTKDAVYTRPKNRQERTIRIGASLVEALEKHKVAQNGHRLKMGARWRDNDLVFPKENGEVQRHYLLWRRFKKDLRAAGLPNIRLHDLRDTAATLMRRSGIAIETLAKILGHSDPAVTMRRYAHVLEDMEEDAAAKVDGWAF
jgi:integrase